MPFPRVCEPGFLRFATARPYAHPLLPVRRWRFPYQGKTHKRKHIRGIVLGLGGCQKSAYVFLGGSFLMGGELTHKQNPQKILGQSREMFVYMFFFLKFHSPLLMPTANSSKCTELLWNKLFRLDTLCFCGGGWSEIGCPIVAWEVVVQGFHKEQRHDNCAHSFCHNKSCSFK